VRAGVAVALAGAVEGNSSPSFERAAEHLRSSPRLLSVLYQNLDLLPPDHPTCHGMALLIGEALEPSTPSS